MTAAYDLDGLWVDGECWATELDYSPGRLDFLSGDYSPGLSVDRARVEARYLANTGMPWDLMAWGFDHGKEQMWSLKRPVHLQQEAAVVLMQGGGFQVYNNPTRSGYIIPEVIDQLGEVADFCRERQALSHKSRSIPQVALLLSETSLWDNMDRIFSPWAGEFDELEGALHILLELHYSVDILAEHQLIGRLSEFPLVVIPDAPKLGPAFQEAVASYVEKGGSLLLLGEKCARLFEPLLGVTLSGDPKDMTVELAAPAEPPFPQPLELPRSGPIQFHRFRPRRRAGQSQPEVGHETQRCVLDA